MPRPVLSPGRSLRVVTLFPGEVLGWSSVTGDTGKQFQVRALEEVHALAFDGARVNHAYEEDCAFGFWFMRAIRVQLLDAYTPVAG